MSIQKAIAKSQMEARKATKKDKELISTLTSLKGEVARIGFDDGKRDTTDEEATKLLKSLIKKIKDSIKQADERGVELTDKQVSTFNREIEIYSSFLPEQLSDEALHSLIDSIIEDIGEPLTNKSMGRIMGALNKDHKGKFDGATASKYIRSKIN